MRYLSTGLAVLVLLAGCASAGARTTTASLGAWTLVPTETMRPSLNRIEPP